MRSPGAIQTRVKPAVDATAVSNADRSNARRAEEPGQCVSRSHALINMRIWSWNNAYHTR